MKDFNRIKPEEEFEILEYLKLDEDLLCGMLARKFSRSNDLVSEGKRILEEIDESLFQKVCNEMEYCKNKSQFNYMDTKSLAIMLYQNIDSIPYKESNIPKAILATILVKIGLSRFCKC